MKLILLQRTRVIIHGGPCVWCVFGWAQNLHINTHTHTHTRITIHAHGLHTHTQSVRLGWFMVVILRSACLDQGGFWSFYELEAPPSGRKVRVRQQTPSLFWKKRRVKNWKRELEKSWEESLAKIDFKCKISALKTMIYVWLNVLTWIPVSSWCASFF